MAIKVAIRCDATIELGCGHVGRCAALAQALAARGAAVVFLCNRGASDVCSELRRQPFPVVEIEDGAAVGAVLADVSLVVFDHYDIGADEERRYREGGRMLAAIDDFAGRDHDVDVLIDPMPGADAQTYSALVPESCDVRCGADWLLLRPEFSRLREASLRRRRGADEVSRIFVGVGGTDPQVLLPRILRALGAIGGDARIDVALGSRSPSLGEVAALAAASPRDIRLHVDATDVAELMAAADFGVGAGGVMAWERCVLGLPAATLIIVDNQAAAGPFLTRAGASLVLDARAALDEDALANACRRLAGDAEARRAMSEAAASVCDGEGAARAADLLLGRLADAKGLRS